MRSLARPRYARRQRGSTDPSTCSIDTQIDTSNCVRQTRSVGRAKRTYNLSDHAVKTVRDLVAEYHVAPTQDAAVELAIDELARRVRDAAEAELWARAAQDPEFRREAEEIAGAFRTADRESWPA
jgi:hypothetical protein